MEPVEMEYDQVLDDIEELAHGHSYREALSRIEGIDRSDVRRFGTSTKARIFYLAAKCLYDLGDYRRALLKIKVAGYFSRQVQVDSLHAEIKLTCGAILTKLGRFHNAIEEFNESYVFYRRAKNYGLAVYPLSNIAQIHFRLGNLRRSMEVLDLCLGYGSKYLSRKHLEIDKRNLARVRIFAGDFREADELLNSCIIDPGDNGSRAHVSCLKGMSSVFLFDFERAVQKLGSALDHFTLSGIKLDQTVCLEYLGLLENFRGNYSMALDYYQQVLDMPEPTASAVAQTLRMMTDVYIAQGKFKKAIGTARKAEEAINKINERIELGAIYRAYGQIYTHKGETHVARDYFRRSIDLLRETGARYELALTYLACGKSESFNCDERTAQFDMARVLFTEMGVPKRVEQVDEAIADLKNATVIAAKVNGANNGAPVIIVASSEMKRVLAFAERVAGSDMNILLTGETGVGKDLFAAYIHYCSGREGEFVTLNAAAIPNDMIESELFGHTKGAFTGADRDRTGLFQMANDGTIYLNEIADATPEFQAKLLEVVESREVRRLGENGKQRVNFRLIAATNQDLQKRLRDNRFRLDLYHRLNEESIRLPSLRERTDDIPALVQHFLTLLSSSPGDGNSHVEHLGSVLAERDWPGNVRELRTEVSRLWRASHGNIKRMIELTSAAKPQDGRKELLELLKETNWNRREAARRLGVSESTIRYRIKKYNLR